MNATQTLTAEQMPLERLEAEITELAGHLAAGECRWLLLVGEFDRRAGYEQWGCRSTAAWLSWHCGLDMRAAREKVRVARVLEELPAITQEFGIGKLSYSKVRALTRVATPENETDLVMMAEHATAVQVERIVRTYRGVLSADEETEAANDLHARRYFRCDPCDDGSFVINGRLSAETAAILLAALDAARDRLPGDTLVSEDSGVSENPPISEHEADKSGPAGPFLDVAVTNADALVMMAETLLATGPSARTGGDRYQIVVNVDADVLSDDAPGGVCELDGGPTLAPETARRLACDASVVLMNHGESGSPVQVSDKTRAIPASVRRAVNARDQGCRFPACGERRFIDVHHVRHRAHGGTNEMGNLLQLCWFHHRLVHEGGWGLRLDAAGAVFATKPTGDVLPRCREHRIVDGDSIEGRNREHGIEIDPMTCYPNWYGEPLDLDHILTGLCYPAVA